MNSVFFYLLWVGFVLSDPYLWLYSSIGFFFGYIISRQQHKR